MTGRRGYCRPEWRLSMQTRLRVRIERLGREGSNQIDAYQAEIISLMELARR